MKYRLSAVVEVKKLGESLQKIQFGFDVTEQDLNDMGGERELAIFLVCEAVAKELPGARPLFRTMDVWVRALSDQGLR